MFFQGAITKKKEFERLAAEGKVVQSEFDEIRLNIRVTVLLNSLEPKLSDKLVRFSYS